MNLLSSFTELTPVEYQTRWKSPSNIAFVKYWGKRGIQLPANPSLSLTLKECVTDTFVKFTPSESFKLELMLDGKETHSFSKKMAKFLESLTDLPWLNKLSIKIETNNSFPHGAGIASSASGMSAFALCLTDYLFHLKSSNLDFFQVASYLSRLGSGSACRSIYGGFTTWGDESDFYSSKIEVHSKFLQLKDTILIISSEEKSVSSTLGHGRMDDHPFSEARFTQGKNNFDKMKVALLSGDLWKMGEILECEALSLHAMMLTSPKPYTLLKPNSLTIIDMIWKFRKETKLPLFFTLDAGPNLHLIYPESEQNKIKTFITRELSLFVERYIDDELGLGPTKC